uniref:GAG-pre-integrase domain-containing protein n=1 Tax=Lactuca sativa TaxID=4236 RepID=A0A9R1VBV6_LACSA|nr:hypothetical protein LSAT_V11C600308870 [Lactuca sativa]
MTSGEISTPSVSSVKSVFVANGNQVSEFNTGKLLTRHNSDGDLNPFTHQATDPALSFFVSSSSSFWHSRLGHPGHFDLVFLSSNKFISCNKIDHTSICQSCQIAQHKCLPFPTPCPLQSNLLILSKLTCRPHQFEATMASNITSLSLMISPVLYGYFHSNTNLKPMKR